jgi:hypothetical protein
MPRLSYFGVLLAVATFLWSPLASQTSVPNRAADSARVQHLVVRGSPEAMEVEIQTSGAPVAPDTQAITGPDRIIVDLPGALPADELRALKVNRGALKAVRSGLFFKNPPITRVVLDLTEPRSYEVSTTQHAIVVKLGGATSLGSANPGSTNVRPSNPGSSNPGAANSNSAHSALITAVDARAGDSVGSAKLQSASVPAGAQVSAAQVSAPESTESLPAPASEAPPPPPSPPVTVTFENGMLRIHAEKATLAQVLFEVQRQTLAEIAIPAGAEQEQVIAELGPAPARDVLATLLNGSPYNFIFVGTELKLERVLLTRRNPSPF